MLNLTPHTINIFVNGEMQTFEPSGVVARVETKMELMEVINWIPVFKRKLLKVYGLPVDETIKCLVSSTVLAEVPNRPNTYAPNTDSAIRDQNGNIVCVTSLIRA